MRCSAARGLPVVAFLAAVMGGCDSSTGNKEAKVALSTSASSVSVAQGGDATMLVFIARTNFDKTITLSVEGAPAGVTVLVSPTTVTNTTASGTLFISATASADPGSATLVVKATGDGIPDQTISVNLTITVTGTFSLAVLDPSLTVAQGGGGVVTVLIQRAGNNGSNVSLAASGLPAGITASFSESPSASTSTSMTLAAAGGVAPGTYTVTINGTAAGLSNQNTTVSLVVIAPPSTVNVSVPFCAADMPVWFAFQNEGFNWQQVTATGTAFTFAAAAKLAIAFAFTIPSSSQVNVFYLSRTELTSLNDRDCSGPKNFTGTVSGLLAGQGWRVVMGAAAADATSFEPNFNLTNVNSRPLDLVATRGNLETTPGGQGLTPDRMIIRRGLNLATGSAIALDFSTAEAFAPQSNNLTISGLQASDEVDLVNTLWTATSTFGSAHSALLNTTGTATLFSTPAAQMVPGDLHELSIQAIQPSQTLVLGRQYVEYFGAPSDRSVAIGPQLTLPAVSVLTRSPYPRLRVQLGSQVEYNTSVQFGYLQGPVGADSIVQISVTAAYLGATPATWDAITPDFTGVTGLNTKWMLRPNETTIYFAQAFSGRTDLLFGALPASGDIVRLAFRAALTNTIQMSRMRAAPNTRRSLPQYLRPGLPQYLRR